MKNKKLSFAMMFVGIVLYTLVISAAQLPVDLGTAGNFVVLSKAGISTTGTTSITGDIGVSPIDSTAITGFGLIMDSSNEFATSSLVTGKVYAADYTTPTDTLLTTAIMDMQTAYSDSAGRTLPDFTELGAGEIGGRTLTPGLYKWSTGLSISSDVTLSGSSTGIWIFQIAETLEISSGKQIILSDGAQAKNIFWQVGGQTTLGTTSKFSGNILSKTLIEMNTGATLNGRALAQTAVTLDANAIVSPGTESMSIVIPSSTPFENSAETSNSDNAESISESLTRTSETPATEIRTTNGELINIMSIEGKTKLNSGDSKVETKLSIEVEQNIIRATQSNGIKSEIKIMPDVASKIALDRLELKVCSEENNCTIELKEVGKGEQTQIVYEFKIQRDSKILGLFKKQMNVLIQVNAENGKIISTEKPWWAFLASEKDERVEEIK